MKKALNLRSLHFRDQTLSNITKPIYRWVLLCSGMILLGVALAVYADSPWLVIPFLGALTLTSFSALDYALYILLVFLPFSFRFIFAYGTEMQVPTEPLLAVMSLALIVRLFVTGRQNLEIKFPFRFPLALYALSLCLSLVNSARLYSSAKGTIRALAYMMIAVITFYVVTDKQRLKRLFVFSVVPAVVAVGWTVIFLIDRIGMWRYSSAYEGLPFTSYSHYGAFVAVFLLVILARNMFDRGIRDRVIWTFLLVFFFIGIGMSFSRGVWVSFIASVGFLFLQKTEGVQHKKILILIGAFALFAFLLSIPPVFRMVTSRLSTIASLSYGTNKERLIRWGTAVMMFLRHPIMGAGYGMFAFTFKNNPAAIGLHLSQYKMGAHNEYLQALAETGIIGFSAWMCIILFFFVYGFRLLKKLSHIKESFPEAEDISFYQSVIIGVMAAELSLMVHFLVNNMIQADVVGVPFWLLIGVLAALGNIIERKYAGYAQ
ncbi:hypothetical protein GF312_13560 [Candidatus Poribacteria bacterium]|nr:hypothetical protein [Candidatus Poribacteria bacterium]